MSKPVVIISDYKPILLNLGLSEEKKERMGLKGANTNYRYIVNLSGRNGLAKSTNFARAILIAGCLKRLTIYCVREVQNSIKDSVHAQFKEEIQSHNLPYIILKDRFIGKNGTEISFRGLQDRNKESIKGMTQADIVWVEEGQSITSQSMDSLTPTVRKEGSFILISGNPDEMSDCVYQMFGEDAPRREDTLYCYKDYRYNPFDLPKPIQYEIALMKKNRPDDYERIYLGKLKNKADMPVVKSFKEEINVGIGEENPREIIWSLDFNINPQCSVICHYDNFGKFYFSEEIVMQNVSTLDVAEEFCKIYAKKYKGREVIINGDASGRNRSSNSEYSNYAIIEQVLTKYKIPFDFQVPKTNPSISNRINNFDWHVKTIDGGSNILINPECVHLINACKLLSYDKNGTVLEIPYKLGMKTIDYAKSHIFDAASYTVMINDPVVETFLRKEKNKVLSLREKFEKDANAGFKI